MSVNSTTTRSELDGPRAYQSTYRRSEIAIPCLIAVLLIFAAGMVAILRFAPGRDFETAILSLAGVTFLLLGASLATAFRVHRWSLQPNGVDIQERPKVPLTGLPRKTLVPFPDIAALRHVESGFDRQIEIMTRNGQRFRLSQAMTARTRGLPTPDPNANLNDFAASIRSTAERSGHVLPAISQGLSFWNSATGLGLLMILFAISLAISGAVAWSLWLGMTIDARPRGGEELAILLLLPVGAGYLLLKSWRRRAVVHTSLSADRPGQ
jgi:hypothetical protein